MQQLKKTKIEFENGVIKRIIKSYNNDYEGIINASKYHYNNSIFVYNYVEGQVLRLKQVKQEMFGRGSIELLRNKVLYRSNLCI